MNVISDLYSKRQQGGELPYFVGKQYGSGWLKTIGRFAFPILRKLGLMAAQTATDVIAKDKPFLPTLKRHAMETLHEATAPKKHKNTINKRRHHGTIFQK